MPFTPRDSRRSAPRSDLSTWLLLALLLLVTRGALTASGRPATSPQTAPTAAVEASLCREGSPCGAPTLPAPLARHLRRRDAVEHEATAFSTDEPEAKAEPSPRPVVRLRDRTVVGLEPDARAGIARAVAAVRFAPHLTDLPPPRAA